MMGKGALALFALIFGAAPVIAQDAVESFYRGKTVTVVIGFGVGGGYDAFGRLVARYIGKYLPGHPTVVPFSRSMKRGLSKTNSPMISLLKARGVEGDLHCGKTVRHTIDRARNPFSPNLRQIHLLEWERLEQLRVHRYDVSPGALGENITTTGVVLTALPRFTKLRLGQNACIQLTDLRNPSRKLEDYKRGLVRLCMERVEDGSFLPKLGVMGIVLENATVQVDDCFDIEFPPLPHTALQIV